MGTALVGIGFTAEGETTTWFEALLVQELDGAVTYTALPGGRAAVDFPVAQMGTDTALFANPAHDHPQRIRYTRQGQVLTAETGSDAGGSQRWTWTLAAPRTAPALEAADRGFAADSAARGAEAWAAAFTPDGVIWRRGGVPTVGTEAIRSAMTRAFADPRVRLAWEPFTSGLSPAGDMGFTAGRYRRDRGPDTAPSETGIYVTIWRHEPGDTWRAVFDAGFPD